MATVDQQVHHAVRDQYFGPGAAGHHGQGSLAEVIMIRPVRSHRSGLLGSLVTMARVLASPRIQATSARSTPRPPSSPALRLVPPLPAPDDAA